MTKEVYKYPYNGRTEDEIKVFLSDQICEKVVKITYRNGQIFCTIRDRITSKKKEIILSAAIIFGALFVMPTEAKPIGVPVRLPSAPEINRPAPQYFYQHAPTVNPRVDKIIMITNNKMIPLIYINGHYSYINEQLLKKLRAGDLASNITVVAIGVLVYIMFQLAGVDAFQIIANWNAPTPNIGGPPPVSPTAELSSSANLPGQGRRSTALQAYAPSHTQASTFTNNDGSVNLDLGYREVLRRARFSTDFECSFDRFIELASEDGETTTDTMRAAISALQLEADGIVSNVRRDPVAEANRVKAFDFLVDGPNGETHLEIKGPVGSEIRKAAGLGPSIPKQGKKIGFKIKNQLNYWFNPNTDNSGITQPESRNKVLVVNDLFDVPSAEKSQMESSINFGLKGEHPILFINNKMNR